MNAVRQGDLSRRNGRSSWLFFLTAGPRRRGAAAGRGGGATRPRRRRGGDPAARSETELRAQTIAPMKRSTETPSRALIVAFDRDRIAMSLRTNDATPIVRDIPTPTDRAARLRAIAWLAGNLARDQVTPIVAEAPTPKQRRWRRFRRSRRHRRPSRPRCRHRRRAATADVSGGPGHADRCRDRRDTARIASPENLNGPDQLVHHVRRWSDRQCRQGSRTSGLLDPPGISTFNGGPKRDGFLLGAALSGTNGDFAPEGIGMLVFMGSASRRGRWTFEATIGAGVELAERVCPSVTATHSSTDGFVSTATQADAVRPGLLADAGVAVAHPLWQVGRRRRSPRGASVDPLGRPTGFSPPLWGSGTTSSETACDRSLRRHDAYGRGVDPRRCRPSLPRWVQVIWRRSQRRSIAGTSACASSRGACFPIPLPPRTSCRMCSRRSPARSADFGATWISRRSCSASRSSGCGITGALHIVAGKRSSGCARSTWRGPINPEQDTYRRQLGARLAAALDQLPLPQRVAFVLCEVEELTSVQAAVIADAPEATIRTRLFHARRRLRDLLAGERG